MNLLFALDVDAEGYGEVDAAEQQVPVNAHVTRQVRPGVGL